MIRLLGKNKRYRNIKIILRLSISKENLKIILYFNRLYNETQFSFKNKNFPKNSQKGNFYFKHAITSSII